ncbi:MAG: AraC family transcriptional regulator [Clostridia bacterium]|nr:AraC family transcriptional regulator [Clostridia bacterium]
MPTEIIHLTLPEDELRSSVGFLHQMSVQDTYPLHTHDFYEFFYVLGGRAIHDINGEKQLLTQGTLVFIRPEDVHRYHFISNHDMELLSCGVTRELVEKACGYMNLSEDAFLNLPAPPQIVYPDSTHWYMSQRLLAIGKHAPGDARRQYFLSILPDLLQQMLSAPESAKGQLPPWVSRLVLKMSKPENFIEGLSRMVALSGVSQEHLNRAFKRYLGITPTAFINMKRINYAAELLRQGKPLLEACMSSGFNHVSYFYQVFEKTYHCTPKQFSKAQQSGGDQHVSE